MDTLTTRNIITDLIAAVENLIPVYMQNTEDQERSKGNVAFCIIDEDGNVSGKFMGPDKIRTRELYRIAWTKASQVHITGVNTGNFEKMYFNDLGNVNSFGIKAPDLIGWEGGQALHLKNGKKLFVGFSGFRSATDLEIMQKALAYIEARYQ
ncbi:hypothetical protein KXQ82_10585 [Mucilaginibacter sp. HMF5004]|uniref:hypothetical protein n=1 Tax=Mucilaginibacter rivuli TaxID=2857527 RepID=UPI001C606D63|nr:hypothetical protein [Mucilaginibacter rivuli]MBW4890166.1 hypothetical protein [Mucilaginibacter rivuli]